MFNIILQLLLKLNDRNSVFLLLLLSTQDFHLLLLNHRLSNQGVNYNSDNFYYQFLLLIYEILSCATTVLLKMGTENIRKGAFVYNSLFPNCTHFTLFFITVVLQCSVNFWCTEKWPSYIYICTFFFFYFFHHVASQMTGYHSMYYTAGPHCLSTPKAIVCIY